MAADTRPLLARLWRPASLPEDRLQKVCWRLHLLNTALGLLAPMLLTAFLVARFVLHLPVSARILFVILAAYLWSTTALNVARAIYLFRSGSLRGFRKQQVRRADHPLRFWIWTTLHMTALAGTAAVAFFLTWMSVDPASWT